METIETTEKKQARHMGKNISIVRIFKSGITQEELAHRLGSTQSEVSRDERKEILDDEKIEKYSKALGISPEFIRESNPEDYMGVYNPVNDVEINHNSADNSNDNPNYNTGSLHPEQTNYYTDHEAWKEVVKAKEESIKIKDEIITRQDKRIEQIEAELKELRDILIGKPN